MASTNIKSAATVAILTLITGIGVIVEKITRPELTYIGWDQVITLPDSPTTIKFKSYVDGSNIGSNIIGVTCIPFGVMFTCKTKVNNLNLTPELHTIRISTVGVGGESIKTAPIEVNFLVVSQ